MSQNNYHFVHLNYNGPNSETTAHFNCVVAYVNCVNIYQNISLQTKYFTAHLFMRCHALVGLRLTTAAGVS